MAFTEAQRIQVYRLLGYPLDEPELGERLSRVSAAEEVEIETILTAVDGVRTQQSSAGGRGALVERVEDISFRDPMTTSAFYRQELDRLAEELAGLLGVLIRRKTGISGRISRG